MRFALTATLLVAAWAGIGTARAAETVTVPIAYLGLLPQKPQAATTLDPAPVDEGLLGARLGLADDQTTAAFTGQNFVMSETLSKEPAAILAAAREKLDGGSRVFVTDLPADLLLRVADLPGAKDALWLDATDDDDRLRCADCRKTILHLLPSAWCCRRHLGE